MTCAVATAAAVPNCRCIRSVDLYADHGRSVELDHAQELGFERLQLRRRVPEAQAASLLASFDECYTGHMVQEMIEEDRVRSIDIDLHTKFGSANDHVNLVDTTDVTGGHWGTRRITGGEDDAPAPRIRRYTTFPAIRASPWPVAITPLAESGRRVF